METQGQLRLVSPRVVEAVHTVIGYLWDEERDDFLSNSEEVGGHIFESLVELVEWLNVEAK